MKCPEELCLSEMKEKLGGETNTSLDIWCNAKIWECWDSKCNGWSL